MPNQLNKDWNKIKGKDGIRTAQENLILAQQAKCKKFQKTADEHRSTQELLEETQQRVELVEEAREEFLNLSLPREENPDGRESTCMARSAEGARAWSELFVQDTLSEGTTSEDPSSPRFTTVETVGVGAQTAGMGVNSASVVYRTG